MHRLNHARIHNFRSCWDAHLTLGSCTPIVGYNNAGKSNLLDALEWLVTSKLLAEFTGPAEANHGAELEAALAPHQQAHGGRRRARARAEAFR